MQQSQQSFVCTWEKWQLLLWLACFFRTVHRRSSPVRPNRRARGSSDCGTPLTTSILPTPVCTTHQVLFSATFLCCRVTEVFQQPRLHSWRGRPGGLGPRITNTAPWNVRANTCDHTLWIESVAILPFPATQPTIGSPGARLSLCLSAEQLRSYGADFLPGGGNPWRDSAMTTSSLCGAPLRLMAAHTRIWLYLFIYVCLVLNIAR